MKTIVVYYSNKGSNKYLAEKAARALDCELRSLIPRAPGLIIPATLSRISMGIKPLTEDFKEFDSVLLCGPLYMGKISAPCNDFIRKYSGNIRRLDFITCCGSTDEKKNDSFGYGRVFSSLKKRLGNKAGIFEAFPIALVLSEEERGNGEAMMKTRLSDRTFQGSIQNRFDRFIEAIKA